MIRCMAVDDEPLALEVLVDFINKIPTLQVISKCDNAIEAIEILSKTQIDVLFLDIQMPDVNGFQLLKTLEKKPIVVFTTAYPEHAVRGFELDAADYLLKPFSFERFNKAVDKARKILESGNRLEDSSDSLFIKSGYETVKILINDILYLEALKDYIQIFTKDKKHLTLSSMKSILEALPEKEFVRVHRSYIVPIKKITKYSAKWVYINDTKIPIGDSYKEQFQNILSKNKA